MGFLPVLSHQDVVNDILFLQEQVQLPACCRSRSCPGGWINATQKSILKIIIINSLDKRGSPRQLNIVWYHSVCTCSFPAFAKRSRRWWQCCWRLVPSTPSSGCCLAEGDTLNLWGWLLLLSKMDRISAWVWMVSSGRGMGLVQEELCYSHQLKR